MGNPSFARLLGHQWLLLFLPLLFTGCANYERTYSFASPPKLIFKDPAFTLAALMEGQLAVGAVTRPGTEDYFAAEPIAQRMYEQLQARWPDIKISSAVDTARLLGKEKYQQMQADFREDAVLTPAQLGELEPLAARRRYLFLVDVREEWDESSREAWTMERKDTDFFTGKERDETVTEYRAKKSSKRFMRALFIIYDLQTRQHVWIASAAGSNRFVNAGKSDYGTPDVREAAAATPGEVAAYLLDQVMPMLPASTAAKPMVAKSRR